MEDKNQEFIDAVNDNNVDRVKILLRDSRVDPSVNNNWAIKWAADRGLTGIVKALLNDGRVDPAAGNNYAIRWAAGGGHMEVVKALLNDGRADPSAENNNAIIWAAGSGLVEVVELLLQDPRVDWRVIKDNPLVKDLLKQQNEQMKNQLTTSYLHLQNKLTQTLDLGQTDKGQQTITKPILKSEMIKQMSYRGIYEELCSNIPPNIKIPPMKLIALANAMKIEYDFNNINWVELCAKVKIKLNLVVFH